MPTGTDRDDARPAAGRPEPPLALSRVLVAVDGSAAGERALRWAVGLAEAFGAEVVAIHAVGLLEELDERADRHATLAEARRRFEAEWCAPLNASAARHRLVLDEGPAVEVILAAARREAPELIVLGSRGSAGWGPLHLGSTSHQVAGAADRPVLIVPPPPG